MLPPGNRPRPLRPNTLHDLLGRLRADIRALRQRGVRNGRRTFPALINEPLLARVPLLKHLLRGRGADQARVGHAREAHAGDVPRARVDAFEVPDRFRGARFELLRCVG